MSKAEELAEEMLRLADLSDAGRGPAKSDPRRQAAAELRRLATLEEELNALKSALMDAEPVKFYTDIRTGDRVPLYTLNGIKP